MIERVERGFASLGVTSTTRAAAVSAAIARVRSVRERPDPAAAGAVRDALFTRENAAVRAQVETALSVIRAGLGVVEGIMQAEAGSEVRRAAEQGREPNFTARDVAKALSWIKWFLGGTFPSDVAENDLRLLNSVIATAAPLIVSALELAKADAIRASNLGLSNALTGIAAYVSSLPAPIAAAVAALPPPETLPVPEASPPPPGGGFTVIGPTGIRCPDGEVSTAYGCRPPCPAGTYQGRSGCVPFARPIGPDSQPIDFVRCPDGSFASSAARCPSSVSEKKGGGGVLLALPAALLAWYLFK